MASHILSGPTKPTSQARQRDWKIRAIGMLGRGSEKAML
jgi:hypothetical protein